MTDLEDKIKVIIEKIITENEFDDIEELLNLILEEFGKSNKIDDKDNLKNLTYRILEEEYNVDDISVEESKTDKSNISSGDEKEKIIEEEKEEYVDTEIVEYYCRERYHKLTMKMESIEAENFPRTQLLYCCQCNKQVYFDYEDGKEIDMLNNKNIDFLVNFSNMSIDKSKKYVSDFIPNKKYHESDKEYGLFTKIKRSEEFLRKQVDYLLTVPQPEQRTEAWYRLREGRLTASDLATALNESKYDKPIDLILKKCGLGPPFKGNVHTEWGVKYEPIATMIYEQRNNVRVIEFGLMPHPSIPFLGASPDGITPEGMMLEIKCPPVRKIDGIIPHNYWLQMQLQLETCDLEECDFLECKLVEYADEEEYYEDVYMDDDGNVIDPLMTINNLEKGVLITYDAPTEDEPNKKRYIYPDRIGLTKDEINSWCEEKGKEFDEKEIPYVRNYWKLEKLSCVRVDRNRKWFEVKLPVMKAFWKDICFYRSVGCDELIEKKNKNKRPKKPKKEDILEEFAFLSDDTDDGKVKKQVDNLPGYSFINSSDEENPPKNKKINKVKEKKVEEELEDFAFLSDSDD